MQIGVANRSEQAKKIPGQLAPLRGVGERRWGWPEMEKIRNRVGYIKLKKRMNLKNLHTVIQKTALIIENNETLL